MPGCVGCGVSTAAPTDVSTLSVILPMMTARGPGGGASLPLCCSVLVGVRSSRTLSGLVQAGQLFAGRWFGCDEAEMLVCFRFGLIPPLMAYCLREEGEKTDRSEAKDGKICNESQGSCESDHDGLSEKSL